MAARPTTHSVLHVGHHVRRERFGPLDNRIFSYGMAQLNRRTT